MEIIKYSDLKAPSYKLKAKNYLPLQAISSKLKATNGFTLLEVLLSIALIGALVGLSLPVYSSFQARNNLDIATSDVVQALRSAQTKSTATELDSAWGVEFAGNQIIVFKGSDFAGRDQNFDEKVKFSPGITFNSSSISEILYVKLTGNPVSTGTIVLENSSGNKKNITINEKGTIIY